MDRDPQQDSYQPVVRDRMTERRRHEEIPGYIEERALIEGSRATAVGRLLKAKPGQKHVHKVIAVNAEGQTRTIINRPAQ